MTDGIDAYLDAAPRVSATPEEIGPFTLFRRPPGGHPYYARPSRGATTIGVDDVSHVRERQRTLGLPQAFEWVFECHPQLATTMEQAGLRVSRHPLMVLTDTTRRPRPVRGVEVWKLDPTDDLASVMAIAALAFAYPGTAIGPVGTAELNVARAAISAPVVDAKRDRLARGAEIMMLASVDGVPAAIGSHCPVGQMTEVVGVGTLPEFRRRGIAGVLTRALVDDARARGCDTVFLSAGDATIARVYERVGFSVVGAAGAASPG